MELVNKPYHPISCDFYDELTWCLVQKKMVAITYLEHNTPITIQSRLRDIQTKNKAEYLILDSGLEIRLDQLLEVDGKLLKNYC